MGIDKNVIRIAPRRYRVTHKGMSGWVEYHPGTKSWSFKMKYQAKFSAQGGAPTEAEAVLELRRAIDILLEVGSDSFRSIE